MFQCLVQVWKIFVHADRLLKQNAVVACRPDQFDHCKQHQFRGLAMNSVPIQGIQIMLVKFVGGREIGVGKCSLKNTPREIFCNKL